MSKSSGVGAAHAVIKFSMDQATQKLILAVLAPELSHRSPSRSSVSISGSTEGISIRLRARDLSSFRASVSSILRLLNVIVETQRTIKNGAR